MKAAVLLIAVALSPELFGANHVGTGDDEPIFEFHSGFWVNLHHQLFEQALDAKLGRAIPMPSGTAPERKLWRKSIAYYRENFFARTLLNHDMWVIKNALEDQEAETKLRPDGLTPGLIAVLELAAPIYRAHEWARQDRANRAWIERIEPLLRQHGARLKQQLARIYDTPWPSAPLRVDVSYYANWAGAYTTIDPTRITIASSDERDQGATALEILFHEGSHGLVSKLLEKLDEEARVRRKTLPRPDVWHALLFYTTGELVREASPGHIPYAQTLGLWDRAWPGEMPVFDKHWKPRIAGKATLDEAVASIVRDLPTAESTRRFVNLK